MIQTENEAREWLSSSLDVPRGTLQKLDDFAALLSEENERQNLVARSTLGSVWVRHIVDSAQLLLHDPGPDLPWIDLGSGAGFPGLIVAALRPGPVTLVESRKLRTDFLRRAAALLAPSTIILESRLERIPPAPFAVITARAFAPLGNLLHLSHPFSTEKTRWILPKGRSAQTELEAARASWHGAFRLAPSITDTEASIIIAEAVRPRTAQRRRREPQ